MVNLPTPTCISNFPLQLVFLLWVFDFQVVLLMHLFWNWTKKKIRKAMVQTGCKEIIFTAYHLGKLKLTFTSPDVISTSPKSFLTSRNDFTVLLLFEFLKKIQNSEFTNPIAKSTSPGLWDTTFFAHWQSWSSNTEAPKSNISRFE